VVEHRLTGVHADPHPERIAFPVVCRQLSLHVDRGFDRSGRRTERRQARITLDRRYVSSVTRGGGGDDGPVCLDHRGISGTDSREQACAALHVREHEGHPSRRHLGHGINRTAVLI
jgi:hypothetical protein